MSACRLLSGSRYVFRRIRSVLFLIVHNSGFYAAAQNTGLIFTQLYSFPRSKYLLVTQKEMTSIMEARSRFSPRKLSPLRVCPVCEGDLGTFPSYKPLTPLSKPSPYWAVIIMPLFLHRIINQMKMTRINHTGILYLKEL